MPNPNRVPDFERLAVENCQLRTENGGDAMLANIGYGAVGVVAMILCIAVAAGILAWSENLHEDDDHWHGPDFWD